MPLGSYSSPLFSSYSNPYSMGPYANHSSIIAANYIRPVISPYTKPLTRIRIGYTPLLATISEAHAGARPLTRISSPKVVLHSSPKFKMPRPISINTADIDVSVNKYRKYNRSPRSPDVNKSDNIEDNSKEIEQVSETAKGKSPLRRDRAVVRIHTIHKRSRKKQPTQYSNEESSEPKLTRRWRDNYEEDKPKRRERKLENPAERLLQKHLIKDKADEERSRLNADNKKEEAPIKDNPLEKSPSFHDICKSISSDALNNDDLNPGQPEHIKKRQSRTLSSEDIFKKIRRNSAEILQENVILLDQLIMNEHLDKPLIEQDEKKKKRKDSESKPEENRASVKRKKKITRKKTNESLPSDTEEGSNKSTLQRRLTQKKIRRLSSDSSLHIEPSQFDQDTEQAYQDAIRDISQVEVEEIKLKPKPIITATVDIDTPKANLKAVIDDVQVEEIQSPKFSGPKFKLNFTIEDIEEKRRSTPPTPENEADVSLLDPKTNSELLKEEIKQHEIERTAEPIQPLISKSIKRKHTAHMIHILDNIQEEEAEKKGSLKKDKNFKELPKLSSKIKQDTLATEKKSELKPSIEKKNEIKQSMSHEAGLQPNQDSQKLLNKFSQEITPSKSKKEVIKNLEHKSSENLPKNNNNQDNRRSLEKINSQIKEVKSKIETLQKTIRNKPLEVKLATPQKAETSQSLVLSTELEINKSLGKKECEPPSHDINSKKDVYCLLKKTANLKPLKIIIQKVDQSNQPKTLDYIEKQQSLSGELSTTAEVVNSDSSASLPGSKKKISEIKVPNKERTSPSSSIQKTDSQSKLLTKKSEKLSEIVLEKNEKNQSHNTTKTPPQSPTQKKSSQPLGPLTKSLNKSDESVANKTQNLSDKKESKIKPTTPPQSPIKKLFLKNDKEGTDINFWDVIGPRESVNNSGKRSLSKPPSLKAKIPNQIETTQAVTELINEDKTVEEPKENKGKNQEKLNINIAEQESNKENSEGRKRGKLISKRSLVNKPKANDPDLEVFIVPEEPDPEPEEEKKEEEGKFVPLQSNRLSNWMHPFKKPEQHDVCPIEIYAKPKLIRYRHIPRPRHPVPSTTNDNDSSESSESEDEDSEESDSSEDEDNVTSNAGTSTSSNDSGFDSPAPGSPSNRRHNKGSSDNRDSPTANPAHNPAFALDAGDIANDEILQSSTYVGYQKSGRITPPATTIPRFRKYTIEDFQFLKVLGKGSFGKVLLAELKNTEYYYAIKCLKKDVVLEDDDVECTLIERKVLALGTKHPYLCHLLCTFQTESHLFFVMEYLNGGDLMFHIQQTGRFPEARGRFYAAEIASGLKFLHSRGIVYRDLKLDNILLDFDGHVRIADFGMCKLQIFLDRTADTFCGTPDYMAPEIIKGQHYNQCVDWWSYGVLLYEMLIGQSPFSGCDEDELFWSICNEKPLIPRYLSAEANSIILLLLEKDASKRLGNKLCSAGDLQDQPFFQQIAWDRLEARLLEPPFKPKLQHPLDTQYFDKTFTVEKAKLTPIEKNILLSMDQTQFQGFSYTNPNATDK